MIMPTIELFLQQEQQLQEEENVVSFGEFLNQARQHNIQVSVWVVDSKELLYKTLSIEGITGVISNRPVVIKGYFEEICGTSSSISSSLL